MANPQGTVRYSLQDGALTFHVVGRGTMAQSAALRRHAERSVGAAAGVTQVRIDLRDCTYMDSTFLGTLLTLKKSLDRPGLSGLSLVMPSTPCRRIIEQMGLGQVLTSEANDIDPDAAWTELPCDTPDPVSFRRTVTQAHEELASLPGPAGEQFQQALRCLNQADKGQVSPPPAPAPAPKPTDGQ